MDNIKLRDENAKLRELLRYLFYYRLPLGDKMSEYLLCHGESERYNRIYELLESTQTESQEELKTDADGMIKILEEIKSLPLYKRTVVMTDSWVDFQVAALKAVERMVSRPRGVTQDDITKEADRNYDLGRKHGRDEKADLLDWAETLLCDALPMPNCTQEDWDFKVKKWRDDKNRVSKSLNAPSAGKEMICDMKKQSGGKP